MNECDVVYEANFAPEHLTPATFSARRLPDRVHYRIVRCRLCRLMRSDPILDDEAIKALYQKSAVTYQADYPALIATYRRYLRRATRYLASPASLLEIGCGDGFFLHAARASGYHEAWGVEPSAEAAKAADDNIRSHIIEGFYHESSFPPARFDCACLFQVLDHLPDPRACMRALARHLKPNGIVLCISHDTDALLNRILGRCSPIIDIEHTYLFSRRTAGRLFANGNFRILETGPVWNTHTLRHWLELAPLPATLKTGMIALLHRLRLSELTITIPAGNFYLIAQQA